MFKTTRPMRLAFTVQGMSCSSCANAIEKGLATVEGVVNPSVNFAALRAEVDYISKSPPTCDAPSASGGEGAVSYSYTPASLRLFHANVLAAIKAMGYRVEAVGVTRRRFLVRGMTCASCANFLEKALLEEPLGVLEVSVVFTSLSADVVFLSGLTSVKDIEKRIVTSGYTIASPTVVVPTHVANSNVNMNTTKINNTTVAPVNADFDLEEEGHHAEDTLVTNDHVVDALERRDEIATYRNKFLGSLAFSLPLMVAMVIFMIHPFMAFEEEHTIAINGVYMVLALPVFYFGRDYFTHAASGLRRCQFTMDTLVAVGVGGAYVFSVMAWVMQWVGMSATCYFDTAGELMTFMLLGKFLEAMAKAKTSGALVLLLKLTPPTATLLRAAADGTQTVVTVPSASLQTGDVVRVAAGDKIPVDGTVVEGVSEVDEAAVTGESVPRQVGPGSRVVGGTINAVSVVTVRATAVGGDTVVSQIIRIVEEAQRTKPAIQRFADRIASVFVPLVMVLSALVFGLWCVLGAADAYPAEWRKGENAFVFAFQNFLSTLVVACPCALGLATPTAIMVGAGVGAEMGVLAKSGIVLETAPTADTFVFDKTGTITTGRLSVTSAAYFDAKGKVCVEATAAGCEALLRQVEAVENAATHPIAVAIANFIREELCLPRDKVQAGDGAVVTFPSQTAGAATTPSTQDGDRVVPEGAEKAVPTPPNRCSPFAITEHSVVGGKGVRALVNGAEVRVGTLAFVREVCAPEAMPAGGHDALELMRQQGRTIVVAAVGGAVVAIFGLADQPKPEARAVVAHLQSEGKRVMIVTGDNEAAALRVGRLVGIAASDIVAGCMPADKERIVSAEQRKGAKVAFIGDGINDSPALAQANIGIALGAGTDIAIECADAVLMHDSLEDIIAFVALARTVVRRIRLNFVWAFGYNVIMLPIAAGALFPIAGVGLPPVVAGIAMITSSLSVLLSSLTLRCFVRPTVQGTHEEAVWGRQLATKRKGAARYEQCSTNATVSHLDAPSIVAIDSAVSDERAAVAKLVAAQQQRAE